MAVFVGLYHLLHRDVEGVHQSEDLGEMLGEELFPTYAVYSLASSGSHEESQSTARDSHALLLKEVERARHCVDIHLHLGGEVTHGR